MQDVPYGYCHCGCGQRTNLMPHTDATVGRVKGQPYRFVINHDKRRRVRWTVEDCGYETPCWVWSGARFSAGYGNVRQAGRNVPAHRAVWIEMRGPIPSGLELDHLCRNPPCVNPDHLEPVTPAVNSRRSRRTKLRGREVAEIRDLCRSGVMPQRTIAKAYGVGKSTIDSINRGETWMSEWFPPPDALPPDDRPPG